MSTADSPASAGSIPAMAQVSARRWGERDAVIDGGVSLTFAEVAAQMMRVGRALIASGVKPGDRVTVWAPNSLCWIPAALGAQAVGAWLVPLNTRMKGHEAAYILEKTDSVLLFTPKDFLGLDYAEMVRSVAPHLRALGDVIELPRPGEATGDAWERFLARGDSVPEAEVQARIDAIRPEDICDVMFTSGTTGHPKGVMLRHGTSLRGYSLYNHNSYRLLEGDRHLVATPFFHCFGYKAGWMLSLMNGATTYPVAVYDAESMMKTVNDARITHMPGPPTMFSAVLEHPDRPKYDLSSLRVSILSAASIPEQLVHRVRHELGVTTTLTGYGLTENHALVSVSTPEDEPHTIATTAGRLFDDLEIRVVDDDGNDVPFGEQGELLVRGFLHMSGYYGDEEATAKTIVDGWLHTGDVVRELPNRYITITDRKKDMYIMGGFNVAPAEVERVLAGLDGVAQVAVIGAPDDHFGEVGAAFVIPQAGADVTPDAVIAYAKEHLANYKVPRIVELIDALPLNGTGKVLKHELRAILKERQGARA